MSTFNICEAFKLNVIAANKPASTHTCEQRSSTSVRLTQAHPNYPCHNLIPIANSSNYTGANQEATENCKQFLNQDSAWLLYSGYAQKTHAMGHLHEGKIPMHEIGG